MAIERYDFLNLTIDFVLEQDIYNFQLVGKVTGVFADETKFEFSRSANTFNFAYSPSQKDMENEMILATEYLMYTVTRKINEELKSQINFSTSSLKKKALGI